MIMQEPWAWVRFTGATGAIVGTSRGLSATNPVVRNGAGDYTLNLERELDAQETLMVAHGTGGAAGDALEWTMVHTSDSAKQILGFSNAGAAADATTVTVALYRMSGGSGR